MVGVMGTHVESKFEIKSWDEQPYQESADGQKLTRASVVLAPTGGDLSAEAGWEALMHYAADGTSRYVGLMRVDGTLGGRTGTFVLSAAGHFDGTTASGTFEVLPGSGTGELAGLTGTGTSVSTHADYPFMPMTLDYEVG
jgi:hypothetical protein